MKLRSVVFTLAALVTAAPTWAMAAEPVAPAAGTTPTDVASAQALLNIETTDKPLETVLQWISRRAGVNVVCNEADQPRITLRLVNVTWQEAVEQIADRYDFVIEKRSERVWQLTRPPKVRMEFQDARLTVVLEALARQANVNIVISDDVDSSRRLTMTLNGVPWREALDVIVKATGYTWIEQNYQIIRVVSKANVQKDLQTIVYRLNYTDGATASGSIAVALSADGKVVHDARTNSLVLTDTPPNLEAAAKILDQLDTRTREVLIEMKFVEYSTSEAERLGFDPISLGFDVEDFGRIGGTFRPFAANPTATLGGLRTDASAVDPFNPPGAIPTSTGNISAALTFEAISTFASTEIIQTPQLLTLDNRPAEIRIGRELRFAEQTISQGSAGTPSTITLAEAKSSPVTDGITINVTPHITSDGFVSIDLTASDENATLQTFTAGVGDGGVSIQLPQKTITKVKTNIMVNDGGTAVIGGILKNKVTEDDRSIPGVNRIPVLGWLFKKQSDTVEQRNLTIFITPRVIANQERDVMGEEKARLAERISGLPQKASQQGEQQRTLRE
ncbi:MAG: hypothetical protein H0W72_04080 [Planctomycetes bacterium]|nr:hypothetical protein [Planctomycetota bacterium]